MYTLDEKLLTDVPEVRIGEKIYPVDNRKSTVTSLMKMIKENQTDSDEGIQKALALALKPGPAADIEKMDMPFPAYQKLFEIVMAAMTGEEPEEMTARFQEAEKSK